MRGQKPALDFGVVCNGSRRAEHFLVDVEPDCRLIVRRWDQDCLLRRHSHAEHRRRIQVREENQNVVLILMALQVLQERRAPGSLLTQPFNLIFAGMRGVEDPFRVAVERIDVARPAVGEAANGHTADAIGSLRVFVLPADVILRAGREDVDLVLRREAFGDETAVVLRSAQNLGAVALDDKSYAHFCPGLRSYRNAPSVSLNLASIRGGANASRRWRCPSRTRARSPRSYTTEPRSSAAILRSFGANRIPAPPSVSGTGPG